MTASDKSSNPFDEYDADYDIPSQEDADRATPSRPKTTLPEFMPSEDGNVFDAYDEEPKPPKPPQGDLSRELEDDGFFDVYDRYVKGKDEPPAVAPVVDVPRSERDTARNKARVGLDLWEKETAYLQDRIASPVSGDKPRAELEADLAYAQKRLGEAAAEYDRAEKVRGTQGGDFLTSAARGFTGALEAGAASFRQYGADIGSGRLVRMGEAAEGVLRTEREDIPRPRVDSFTKIGESGDFWKDVREYAVSKAGEGIGSTVPFMAGGIVAGAPGLIAAGSAMGHGTMVQALDEAGVKDPEARRNAVYTYGSVIAALDVLVPTGVMLRMSGAAKTLARENLAQAIVGSLKTAGITSFAEGTTELSQELVEMYGASGQPLPDMKWDKDTTITGRTTPPINWEEARVRGIDAFLSGLVPGATFTAPEAVNRIGSARTAKAKTGTQTDATEAPAAEEAPATEQAPTEEAPPATVPSESTIVPIRPGVSAAEPTPEAKRAMEAASDALDGLEDYDEGDGIAESVAAAQRNRVPKDAAAAVKSATRAADRALKAVKGIPTVAGAPDLDALGEEVAKASQKPAKVVPPAPTFATLSDELDSLKTKVKLAAKVAELKIEIPDEVFDQGPKAIRKAILERMAPAAEAPAAAESQPEAVTPAAVETRKDIENRLNGHIQQRAADQLHMQEYKEALKGQKDPKVIEGLKAQFEFHRQRANTHHIAAKQADVDLDAFDAGQTSGQAEAVTAEEAKPAAAASEQTVPASDITILERQYPDRIEAVRERFKDGELPPVVVRRDPSGSGYLVVDGSNRVTVAAERGEAVPAIVLETDAYDRLQKSGAHPMAIAYAAAVAAGNETAAKDIADQYARLTKADVGAELKAATTVLSGVFTDSTGQTSLVPEVTTKERLDAQAAKPLSGGSAPMDVGMFGSGAAQTDLLDALKKPAAPVAPKFAPTEKLLDLPTQTSPATPTARSAAIRDAAEATATAVSMGYRKEAAKLRFQKQPVSLVKFLVANGGINDTEGDLKGMDAKLKTKNKRKTGVPGLVRAKGMSPDEAVSAIVQAGYLRDTPYEGVTDVTPSDLYELVREELGGKKHYANDADQAEAERREAIARYADEVDDLVSTYQDEIVDFFVAHDLDFNMTPDELLSVAQALAETDETSVDARANVIDDLVDRLYTRVVDREDTDAATDTGTDQADGAESPAESPGRVRPGREDEVPFDSVQSGEASTAGSEAADLRSRFYDVLESKTLRKDWAEKLGLETEEDLAPLLQDGVDNGWLKLVTRPDKTVVHQRIVKGRPSRPDAAPEEVLAALAGPVSPQSAFWAAVKPLDEQLTGEAGRAIDAWVGGPHDSVEMGLVGGLMVPSRLEEMPDADQEAMAQPVREALRQFFGDTITVYRGVIPGSGQSTGRQNKLVSYTTSPAVARRFAGTTTKRLKVYTEEEIAAAEQQYAETGEVKVGNITYRRDPEWGSVDMFNRDGHITDTPSVRTDLEYRNAGNAEINAAREAAMANVMAFRLPVNSVIWATDRFNQQEIIARAGQETVVTDEVQAALDSPPRKTLSLSPATRAAIEAKRAIETPAERSKRLNKPFGPVPQTSLWLDFPAGIEYTANVEHIAAKRAAKDGADHPLADPENMRVHIQTVLENASFAFHYKQEDGWTLVVPQPNGEDLYVGIDERLNHGRIYIRTAFIANKGKTQGAIRAAVADYGPNNALKWKKDPASIQEILTLVRQAPGEGQDPSLVVLRGAVRKSQEEVRGQTEAAIFSLKTLLGSLAGETATPGTDRTQEAGYRAFAERAVMERNEKYSVQGKTVSRVLSAVRQQSGILPVGAGVGTIERIYPVKGREGLVVAAFRMDDNSTLELTLPARSVFENRAMFHDRTGSILFLRFSSSDSADFVDGIRGGLRHEIVHFLRRQGVLPDDLWARLVDHAKSLNVVNMPFASFLAGTRNPSAAFVDPRTSILTYYSTLYQKNEGRKGAALSTVLDEEAVAHFYELVSHGYWSAEQLAPVQDIIDAIEAGLFGKAAQSLEAGDPLHGIAVEVRARQKQRFRTVSLIVQALPEGEMESGSVVKALKALGAHEVDLRATGLGEHVRYQSFVTRQEMIDYLKGQSLEVRELVSTDIGRRSMLLYDPASDAEATKAVASADVEMTKDGKEKVFLARDLALLQGEQDSVIADLTAQIAQLKQQMADETAALQAKWGEYAQVPFQSETIAKIDALEQQIYMRKMAEKPAVTKKTDDFEALSSAIKLFLSEDGVDPDTEFWGAALSKIATTSEDPEAADQAAFLLNKLLDFDKAPVTEQQIVEDLHEEIEDFLETLGFEEDSPSEWFKILDHIAVQQAGTDNATYAQDLLDALTKVAGTAKAKAADKNLTAARANQALHQLVQQANASATAISFPIDSPQAKIFAKLYPSVSPRVKPLTTLSGKPLIDENGKPLEFVVFELPQDLPSLVQVMPAREPLDLSPKAREERAIEQGFTTLSYRGLTKPYSDDSALGKWTAHFFSRNPGIAATYIGVAGDLPESSADRWYDEGNIIPARLRLGKNIEIDVGGNAYHDIRGSQLPAPVARQVAINTLYSYNDKIPGEIAIGHFLKEGFSGSTDRVAAAVKDLGYDSVTFLNIRDASDVGYIPSTVDVVFDPRNIRSVNAAFDPLLDQEPGILFAQDASRPQLSMTPADRMARAKTQGRTVLAYRGLRMPYNDEVAKKLDFQFFTRDPGVAEGYITASPGWPEQDHRRYAKGGNIVPVRLRLGKNLTIDATGQGWDNIDPTTLPPDVIEILKADWQPGGIEKEIADVLGFGGEFDYTNKIVDTDDLAKAVKRAGYDSLTLENIIDNLDSEDKTTSTIDVVFDPKDVRSVNAGFDPALDQEAGILYAIGAPVQPPRPKALLEIMAGLRDSVGLSTVQQLRGVTVGVRDSRNRLRQIARWIPNALGMSAEVTGQFDRKGGVAYIRSPSDIKTVAHEAAHQLEDTFGDALQALKAAHQSEIAARSPSGGPALSEGFADWSASYVMNPSAAQTQAPRFYEAFEEFLDAESPIMLEGLQEAQKDYQAYEMAAPEARAVADVATSAPVSKAAVTGRMAKGQARKVGRVSSAVLRGKWDRAYQELGQPPNVIDFVGRMLIGSMTDRAHPVRAMVKKLLKLADANGIRGADGKKISLKVWENAYKIARMIPGAFKSGHMFLVNGVLTYGGFEAEGPSLQDAVAVALGGTKKRNWSKEMLDTFGAYLISHRAIAEYARWEAAVEKRRQLNETIDQATEMRGAATETQRKVEAQIETRKKKLANSQGRLAQIDKELTATKNRIKELGKAKVPRQDKIDEAHRFMRRFDNERADIIGRIPTLESEIADRQDRADRLQAAIDGLSLVIESTKKELDLVNKYEPARAPTDKSKEAHIAAKANLLAQNPSFHEGQQLLAEWQRRLLKYEFDAGRWSPEVYAKLLERSDWYVPFMRRMDEPDTGPTEEAQAFGDKLFSTRMHGIKKFRKAPRFRGSDRQIINPLESLVERAYHTGIATMFNDMTRALVDLAEKVGPGGEKIAARVKRTDILEGTEGGFAELEAIAVAQGMDVYEAHMLVQRFEQDFSDTELELLWAPNKIGPGKVLTIPLWEGGERNMVRLNDPDLSMSVFTAMQGLSHNQLNLVTRILGVPSRALSRGTVWHHAYVIPNLVRDAILASIYTGSMPGWTQAKGIYYELAESKWGSEVLKKLGVEPPKIASLYASAAGIMGGQMTATAAEVKDKVNLQELRRHGAHLANWKQGLNPFSEHNWAGTLSEGSETATRLGVFAYNLKKQIIKRDGPEGWKVFVAALARGKAMKLEDADAIREAAFTARDLIDFDRRGSKMHSVAHVTSFLNSATQGLSVANRKLFVAESDRGSSYVEAFKLLVRGELGELSDNDRQALAVAARVVILGSIVSVLYLLQHMLYADDDEYREILEDSKWRDMPVKLPNGEWMRIPRPFEAAFPGNVAIAAYDYATERDPRMMSRVRDAAIQNIVPPYTPQFVTTIGGLVYNTDGFGNPIVNTGQAGLEPWLQFDQFSSEFAKGLAYQASKVGIPMSPEKIDFTLRMGGYWGQELQAFSNLVGRENRPGVKDEFLIGALVNRLSTDLSRTSEGKAEFWNLMQRGSGEYTRAANSYKEFLESEASMPITAKQYLEGLDPERRAYALLKAHFEGNGQIQRLHPLQRADSVMKVMREMANEISGTKGITTGAKDEKQTKVSLSTAEGSELRQILGMLQTWEAANSLIAVGHGQWMMRQPFDTTLVWNELEASSPEAAQELRRRIASKNIEDYDVVRDAWPRIRDELNDNADDLTGLSETDITGELNRELAD